MERNCAICAKTLPIKKDIQTGYYCCDEYYCNIECLELSLSADTTWSEHYTVDGDCYYTEWEILDELQEIFSA